jgi:transcriptional regulator with PAS, ATPase and Fis domain
MIENTASSRHDENTRIRESVALGRLIGDSPCFQREIEKLPRIARSEASVLIRGETGTGKEVVARTIHYLSRRRRGPFVPVNCGAIPPTLVESELFGVEKGAYTGALEARLGLVEEGTDGTLFLDEVDCLPVSAQVKLLRFLQEHEVRHLGSTKTRRVDTRVLAATNSDARSKLADGSLRADLFYRLNVLQVRLPPLRDRTDDVLALARHFLRKHTAEDGAERRLSEEAESALLLHGWPGNVRELEHAVQRALVLGGGARRIEAHHLELAERDAAYGSGTLTEEREAVVSRFEKRYVERMLALHRGNISRAAKAADRSRRGFFGLIKKHGIDVARFR